VPVRDDHRHVVRRTQHLIVGRICDVRVPSLNEPLGRFTFVVASTWRILERDPYLLSAED
jgi:hypothetical protein